MTKSPQTSILNALIASLLGSNFTSETILQVQRNFLTIPAMHFKASAIKAAQQDTVIRFQQLVIYIPHSPLSSHCITQLRTFTQPLYYVTVTTVIPNNESFAVHLQFFLDSVKLHVFHSGCSSYAHFHSTLEP